VLFKKRKNRPWRQNTKLEQAVGGTKKSREQVRTGGEAKTSRLHRRAGGGKNRERRATQRHRPDITRENCADRGKRKSDVVSLASKSRTSREQEYCGARLLESKIWVTTEILDKSCCARRTKIGNRHRREILSRGKSSLDRRP
jgi:hypothetical protein